MLPNLLALLNFIAITFIKLNSGFHPFKHLPSRGSIQSQYQESGRMLAGNCLTMFMTQSFQIHAFFVSTIAIQLFFIPIYYPRNLAMLYANQAQTPHWNPQW
jgi:hypothetical protein